MARTCLGLIALALAAMLAGPVLAKGETVVFNEGLGGGKHGFSAVIAALAGEVPVYYQPRPAHMAGDEDGHRSPSDVARDLRRRLDAAGIAPPYIMVGHSIGGSYALAFAKLYPNEVTGLLLIDPRLPSYTPLCFAEGQILCDITPLGLLKRPESERLEYAGLQDDLGLLSDASDLGALPVTVLGSTVPPKGVPQDWQNFWLDYLRAFSRTAANDRFIAVPGAPHMIQNARPDLVTEEIRRLLR